MPQAKAKDGEERLRKLHQIEVPRGMRMCGPRGSVCPACEKAGISSVSGIGNGKTSIFKGNKCIDEFSSHTESSNKRQILAEAELEVPC